MVNTSMGVELPYVVKIFKDKYCLECEFDRLIRLNSVPNIPNVIDRGHKYLMFKKIPGMDLFKYLNKFGYLNENQAREICLKVLKIVNDIHKLDIIHGDIKLENIMYDQDTEEITLIDFEILKKTYEYSSPETINEGIREKSYDMWCVGIVMYILLANHHPYDGNKHIMNREKFKIKNQIISHECLDFLKCLINKNKFDRFTSEQALRHPWIRNRKIIIPELRIASKTDVSFTSCHILENVPEKIKTKKQYCWSKKKNKIHPDV